jgi:hypothetical protein
MLREFFSFFFFPQRIKFDKKCNFISSSNVEEISKPKLRTVLPHEEEQKSWYGLSEVNNIKTENKDGN